MAFDCNKYGEEVASLLALAENGERLMPLANGTCCSEEAAARLRKLDPRTALAGARAPEAALAGLWLYFSCLDDSHEVSQRLSSPEGSFWHGIMHRQEPDAWNAKYWFRQVGDHAIFPALREEAVRIVEEHEGDLAIPPAWNASWFVDICEAAREGRSREREALALAIQRAEWQLLFDYCASPR